MVLDTATLRKYKPLLVAGLAVTRASTNAAILPCNFSLSNERRPIIMLQPILTAVDAAFKNDTEIAIR